MLSVERKKEIYAVCSKYDVIIVEDEPYWYLQFPSAAEEEAKSRGLPAPAPPQQPYKPSRSSGYEFLDSLTPSFLSLDIDGRVVRLDTFSKTVAPGCRLGWITAQPALIERIERISEVTTQQPSGFVQGLIAELVLGSPHQQQQQARSAFARLRTPREQAAFKGWDMSGWVRWLEGLRGMYERRMARMCRVLDQGARLVTASPVRADPDPDSEWSPLAVSSTPLYSYRWPRGGMFIWLRVHFEAHPLWQVPRQIQTQTRQQQQQQTRAVLDGPALSAALMVFLTRRPFRVLVATGSMFSASDAIRDADGWRYLRICFAAESEENVDRAAERFVEGVHAFWEIRDATVIEELLEEVGAGAADGGSGKKGEEMVEGLGMGEDVLRLGWFLGC